MTYKYAISGINMGGAKAVIWVDDENECSEELYRSYGRMVDSFNGRFVTSGDVGTGKREMRWINIETDYVIGRPSQNAHSALSHCSLSHVSSAYRLISFLIQPPALTSQIKGGV